jgi:hypothetical protein
MRKIATKLPLIPFGTPTVSGTAQVGKTLSALPGNCIKYPTRNCAYQWNNEGSPIAGATGSTYTLQTSDLGALITVQVTPANSVGAAAPALSALAGPVISTTAFYVSMTDGNDNNGGKSSAPNPTNIGGPGAAGPWKTLGHVNAQNFAPGTSVLFKRGDKWDRSAGPSVVGQLNPSNSSSGTLGNPIVYDAYGTGANPILDGSADASQTSDWQLVPGSTTVWESVQTFYPATLKTVSITLANPAVITWGSNGPINGSSVVFANSGGALPSHITAGQIYYVIGASGNTFQISASYNGPAISTAGDTQSGIQTAGANGLPYINANDIGNVIWGFSALGGTTPPAVMTATAGVETGGLSVNSGGNYVYYKPGDGVNNIGTTNGNWNFNTDNFRVQIVSGSVNPATRFPGIRLAMDAAPLYIQNGNYSTFQNLTIQNTANAGIYIFPGSTVTGITIRDNVIQWIGGGNNGGQNQTGRIGDGIDTANGLDHILIERNFIYQCYDGAISPQSSPANRNNMTIRNNVLTLYGTAIGILNEPSSGSNTQNGLYIYNNTCYGSNSWSSYPVVQRPNGNTQRKSMNCSYNSNITVSNQDFRNNVFAGSSAPGNNDAFELSSYTCAIPVLTSTLVGATWNNFDYNNWYAVNGSPTTYLGYGNPSLATWFSNHSFEAHSISGGLMDVNPNLINPSTNDFRPASGSPLFSAGANLHSVLGSASNGVVWDFNHKPRPISGAFTIGAYQ